jgi:endonuclease/exonuclease/phosphatase family metal-dependent hydrolase
VKYGEVKIGDKIEIPDDRELAEVKNGRNLFEEATKQDRRMIWTILKEKSTGKDFFLCNYHMPCTYWWVPVMALHADALLQQVGELAGDLPTILAGDWNSCLRDSNTSEIIEFILGKRDDFSQKPSPSWVPHSLMKYESANTEKITTRTKSPGRDVFSATLDHIFYREFSLKSCKVPDIGEEVLPNAYEGSDHVPVVAELEFISDDVRQKAEFIVANSDPDDIKRFTEAFAV